MCPTALLRFSIYALQSKGSFQGHEGEACGIGASTAKRKHRKGRGKCMCPSRGQLRSGSVTEASAGANGGGLSML